MQQLTSEGRKVTQLPNFADGAVIAQVSLNVGGETLSGSAFGFQKGTIFFGFSDLVAGGAAPSLASLQAEATTVLNRLSQAMKSYMGLSKKCVYYIHHRHR